MTWPQLYVLAAMVGSAAFGIAGEARDRDNSAAHVAFYVVLLLAFRSFMAFALHVGGFW